MVNGMDCMDRMRIRKYSVDFGRKANKYSGQSVNGFRKIVLVL